MNIFFGAGRIGKRYLKIWKKLGLQVDYFIDNNSHITGKYVDGVKALSPDWLLKAHSEELYVYITCADSENIFRQLDDMGVSRSHVDFMSLDLTLALFQKSNRRLSGNSFFHAASMEEKESDKLRVLFDLSNGIVLGGVEAWSIQSAQKLEAMGVESGFLVGGSSDSAHPEILKEKIHRIYQQNSKNNRDWLEDGVLEIAKHRSAVVCNFIGYHLTTACFAKIFFPDTVRIIAVIHSDEEAYYDVYTKLEGYIDKCLIISEKIRDKLIKKGFPMEKCLYLPWEIPCHERLSHVCSVKNNILHLGYAGRIVQRQKRADRLAELAEQLKNRGIPFLLEIAGTGTYQEMLEETIVKKGLSDNVKYLGILRRQDMDLFWKRQDIMISCSEWEGHSISQAEAMASGAVPVITDVSGAADDVSDGYNGYIVPIGDMNALADRICYLYFNREELERMKACAHSTIYEKQKKLDSTAFWNDLLRKVWKP